MLSAALSHERRLDSWLRRSRCSISARDWATWWTDKSRSSLQSSTAERSRRVVESGETLAMVSMERRASLMAMWAAAWRMRVGEGGSGLGCGVWARRREVHEW